MPQIENQATIQPGHFTFVHGAKIREAGTDSRSIRSELMRYRYREKRHREHLERINRISDLLRQRTNSPTVPLCQCTDSILPLGGKFSTRAGCKAIVPRASIGQGFVVRSFCPKCHGAQGHQILPASEKINLQQIAPSQVNPFLADSYKSSQYFDSLLHHCIHVLWPLARPVDFSEGVLQAYLHPQRSPMVIQSMLYSASLHSDALLIMRGNSSTSYVRHTAEQLRLKGLVMGQILQKLSDFDKRQADEDWVGDVLLSILYLAANENLDKLKQPEYGPFNPPFKNLQLLEYYGSCEFHPLHWQTVERIVLQRGGLHTVKVYGLAWLMSISSLIVAVNTQQKPVFPLIYPDGKPYLYRAPLQALKIPQQPRYLMQQNCGFQQLSLLHPPIKGNIIRVFLDFGEILQSIEFLSKCYCSPTTLVGIADSRAIVQHRLCSLPYGTDRLSAILHKRTCTREEQQGSLSLYLLCKQAALLYSSHVSFPLPQTTELRCKLVNDIQASLATFFQQQLDSPPVQEILLWCSVVAGACANDDIQIWFVTEIRRLCDLLKIDTWDKFLVLLRSFAWMDCASDEIGKELWEKTRANSYCFRILN